MEIWKDVKDYEGIYEVSNLGNVKSLRRVVLIRGKYPFVSKEKFLKAGINGNGYYNVVLCYHNNQKTKTVHQLVAEAFLNHKPNGLKLVVNHINFNKLDNRVENLEIVTNRENCNQKHLKSTSKYVGVYWNKNNNKWMACIKINNETKYLGIFENEYDAHLAYQNKLKQIS